MYTMSQNGLDYLKRQEELRLLAYKDATGTWTIGWGSTKDVHKGLAITLDQAIARLQEDLKPAISAVNTLVKVPLTQYQFDALVSLVFNIGTGAFTSSTLLKLLNKKDISGTSAQFDAWVYSRGVKLEGLVNRRRRDRALFDRGEYHAA